MIETARLILRPFIPGDLDDLLAMSLDPVPFPPLGMSTPDRETMWKRLLGYAGHWALLGHGQFAVIDRATGRFLGETGLMRRERGLGAAFDDADEAAWWLTAADRGQGVGIEAAAAAHRWYEETRGAVRTVCLIDPMNEPSLRIAGRLGYREYGRCHYKGADLVTLERNL